jgi:hypothetical protein
MDIQDHHRQGFETIMAKNKKNIYEDLYREYTRALKDDKSIEAAMIWFYREIRTLYGSTSKSLVPFLSAMEGTKKISAEDIGFGRLYLFEYRASRQEDYYDRFPVVLPFTIKSNHIVGFNLHYLPLRYRLLAIAEMLYKADSRFPPSEKRLTKLDYDYINGTSLNFMRVAVRTYKLRRIRSIVGEIPLTGWITASLLPVAQYRGSVRTQNAVNEEMLKQIKNI